MSNDEQIGLLQEAILSLEWAKGYLDEAAESSDPNSSAISKIIRAVKADINELKAA